jgi:hypothetical protein
LRRGGAAHTRPRPGWMWGCLLHTEVDRTEMAVQPPHTHTQENNSGQISLDTAVPARGAGIFPCIFPSLASNTFAGPGERARLDLGQPGFPIHSRARARSLFLSLSLRGNGSSVCCVWASTRPALLRQTSLPTQRKKEGKKTAISREACVGGQTQH